MSSVNRANVRRELKAVHISSILLYCGKAQNVFGLKKRVSIYGKVMKYIYLLHLSNAKHLTARTFEHT